VCYLLFDGLNLNQSPISDRCQLIKGENRHPNRHLYRGDRDGGDCYVVTSFHLIPELIYTEGRMVSAAVVGFFAVPGTLWSDRSNGIPPNLS
jgi:hypothetical protein